MMNSGIVLKLIIAYGVSVFLDLIWMLIYTKGWWNGSADSKVDNDIDKGIK